MITRKFLGLTGTGLRSKVVTPLLWEEERPIVIVSQLSTLIWQDLPWVPTVSVEKLLHNPVAEGVLIVCNDLHSHQLQRVAKAFPFNEIWAVNFSACLD